MEYEETAEEVKTTGDSIKEDRRWCVYVHRNVHNDKRYVGITSKLPEERWGHNGCKYLSKKCGKYKHPAFANALIKYNDWQNDWEHIIYADSLTEEEAKQMEIYLIALYKTNCCKYQNPSFGYNITDGGTATLGWNPTEETRKKMSDKAKERTSDPNNCPMYQKHHTEESRTKMSNALTGKYCGANSYWYGKHISEETKQKLSDTHRGMYAGEKNYFYDVHMCGDENPFFGQKHTEETKEKMRNAAKVRSIKNGTMPFCIELHQLFFNSAEAERKLSISRKYIAKCCRGDLNFAGYHPDTKEKLHWLYADDAIKQGYITQQELDNYLNNLREKEKGDNNNGETV